MSSGMEKVKANLSAGRSQCEFRELQFECHRRAAANGWWPEDGREVGEVYALLHTEISEAFEAVRRGAMDAHLPDLSGEEVELADAVIRIFDYATARGYNLHETLWRKLEYNDEREDHKPEARLAPGGKKC